MEKNSQQEEIVQAIKGLEHEVSRLTSQISVMRLELKTIGMQGKSNGQGFDLILRELEKVALKFDLFMAETHTRHNVDAYGKER